MNSEELIRIIAKGFPISEEVIIPWQSPLDEADKYGKPEVKHWERWEQTLKGMMKVKHTALRWKSIQFPNIPSLRIASLQFKLPSPQILFHQMDCHSDNVDLTRRQLEENFGNPEQKLISFLDKGNAEINYHQSVWQISSTRIKITIPPTGEIIFSSIENNFQINNSD